MDPWTMLGTGGAKVAASRALHCPSWLDVDTPLTATACDRLPRALSCRKTLVSCGRPISRRWSLAFSARQEWTRSAPEKRPSFGSRCGAGCFGVFLIVGRSSGGSVVVIRAGISVPARRHRRRLDLGWDQPCGSRREGPSMRTVWHWWRRRLSSASTRALLPRKFCPLGVVEVGGDDGGPAPIALLHQLEEDVGLLRPEVEIAHLVDQQDVDPDQAVEQLARGAVGEGGVHLVEEVLRAHEEPAVTVLQALSRRPVARPVLPTPVGPMKTMFSALAMKSSSAKARICRWRDAGLALEGEGLERPLLGQSGAS